MRKEDNNRGLVALILASLLFAGELFMAFNLEGCSFWIPVVFVSIIWTFIFPISIFGIFIDKSRKIAFTSFILFIICFILLAVEWGHFNALYVICSL